MNTFKPKSLNISKQKKTIPQATFITTVTINSKNKMINRKEQNTISQKISTEKFDEEVSKFPSISRRHNPRSKTFANNISLLNIPVPLILHFRPLQFLFFHFTYRTGSLHVKASSCTESDILISSIQMRSAIWYIRSGTSSVKKK